VSGGSLSLGPYIDVRLYTSKCLIWNLAEHGRLLNKYLEICVRHNFYGNECVLKIAIIPCVYEGFKHILDLGSVV